MSKLNKIIKGKNSPEDRALDKLLDTGDFIIDEETGLPVKSRKGKTNNYNEIEICSVILPYIREDVMISSRELERLTGLDRRTIGKARKSDTFCKMVVEHTNKEMVTARASSVQGLLKMANNPKTSDNVRAKCYEILMRHSEKMAEINVLAGKEPPAKLEDILKELEEL
ncbi:MAG: hypothetical protein K0S61_2558 [Anaerocolumna sp.]|jgi:hypothetical protein|nr:hypothetical protein [Anaerocolumna sp.]